MFDLQGLFLTYQIFSEDAPNETEEFLGISQELSDYICEKAFEAYFDGLDAASIERDKARCRLAGYLRFLYLITEYGFGSEELKKKRIRHTLEHLSELSGQVDSLEIGFPSRK